MVKLFSLGWLLCLTVYANPIENMAASFMGEASYSSQRNLVRILFSDSSSFIDPIDGSPNAVKVLQTLKENGLLKLFYPETKALQLTFAVQEHPVLFMRIINESLQAMGYSYYLTRNISQNESGLVWVIGIATQHLVDPVLLARQIQSRGARVQTVVKESEIAWYYAIDAHEAKPKVEPHDLNTTITLGKPIQPYWINVSEASRMTLRAQLADKWFPQVVFFDATLNIIEEIRMEESRVRLQIAIPQNAMYAKVEDRYSLDNIKRGLNLYLESR